MSINKGFIFIFIAVLLGSCGTTHHTASVGWESGKVRFDFTPPTGIGSPIIECVTCNGVLPPLPLEVNSQGVGYIKYDELHSYLSERFHLKGSGIDTSLTLTQPQPNDAMKLYGLHEKLIGRIMITRYANVYKDTSMTEFIGTLDRDDEVNLFSEGELFYHVHDPRYSMPVVVLKSHAVRIQ